MDDFWGKGYNDILLLSRPDLIKDIHSAFFDVGCDVVETNTFNSTRIVMAEYQMEDQVHEINLAAAKPTCPKTGSRALRFQRRRCALPSRARRKGAVHLRFLPVQGQ